MNRLAGIFVAVIGLLIAVLSILKVIPSLTWLGVSVILLGGLIIGLSFIDKPAAEETPRMSTPATLINIFFSPTEVFQNLRRHPRWLAALVIIGILWAVFANLFLYRLTPERVTNYAIDKTLEMPIMNDQARREIEKGRDDALEQNKNPVFRAAQSVSEFIWYGIFGVAFLSAVFFLFAIAMGGKINFWQAFSATVYAWFPFTVIRYLLNTVILFIKDPIDIHPILGMQGALIQDNLGFLITPSSSPALYALLSSFAITSFYWIWLQVTGLKNAGERVTPTIAWTAVIVVWLAGAALSTVMAAIFPSFLS